MYSREDKIYVKINKVGFIPYIGICGPIPNPIKIPTATCLQMINAGIDVFEVNPDTKETMKLTVQNVFDDNKFGKKPNPHVQIKTTVTQPVGNAVFTGVKNPELKHLDDVDEKHETINNVENKVSNKEESTSTEKTTELTDVKEQHQNIDYKNKNKNKSKR